MSMRVGRRRRIFGVAAAGAVVALLAVVLTWDDADDPATKVAASDDAPSESAGTSSGSGEWQAEAGYADVRALVQRTARDGTRIAVVSLRWSEAVREGQVPPGEWAPPAECRPIGDLEIGLTGERQTSMGYSPEFPHPDGESAISGSGLAGHPTLGPFFYAAVRTSTDVRSARLRIDDVVVDAAEPKDGWVFLAVQLEPRSAEDDMTPPKGVAVEVVTDDGTRQLAPEDRSQDAECQPPPPSLPASARQATTAEAEAVSAAYSNTFDRRDGDPPRDIRRLVIGGRAIDDELLEKIRELGENYSDIRAEVEKVGIVDDDSAVVVFRLRNVLGWMLGDAELVDGQWLVSGQTFCHLIGMSGLRCPASMWDDSAGPTTHA
jgi:hypothetical protein